MNSPSINPRGAARTVAFSALTLGGVAVMSPYALFTVLIHGFLAALVLAPLILAGVATVDRLRLGPGW